MERQDLILAAQRMRTDDNSNPEYDRALVELVGEALGVLTPEVRPIIEAAVLSGDAVAALLLVQWGATELTEFLGFIDRQAV